MKLEQFHYLLEINRLHSISAAARTLHLGQTTLSAIVKSAEDEVGFPIFQRTPHGVVATPHGERFMALAWEINVKYEELTALKRRMENGGTPAVKVLLSPSVALRIALPLTQRFYSHDVHGDLTFDEIRSELISERVAENNANIGITYLSQEEVHRVRTGNYKDVVEIEELFRDKICLLVSKEHPFAHLDAIDVKELYGERIATAKKMTNDKVLGTMIENCNRVTTFSDLRNVFDAVRQQGMVAFIPRLLAPVADELAYYKRIDLVNSEKENDLSLCLITCKERNLRYAEKLLTNCIRTHFRELIALENADHCEGETDCEEGEVTL